MPKYKEANSIAQVNINKYDIHLNLYPQKRKTKIKQETSHTNK